MDHIPAVPSVTATSLASLTGDQHFQTDTLPPSTSAAGEGFYQVSEAAIMQVLQDGLPSSGTLSHLSVSEPEGVSTSHTDTDATANSSEDMQSYSQNAVNSLASALGINLTSQAAQMLMVSG